MDQGNVTVLASAVPPIEPVFPKMPLVAALAVAVGMLLGVGFAIAVEMIDRRVRGADDLAGLHVWGELEDTSSISRLVERKSRKALKLGRVVRPLQEPSLG